MMGVACSCCLVVSNGRREDLANNLWIQSDVLTKQGSDGLKGGGRSVGRSAINYERKEV